MRWNLILLLFGLIAGCTYTQKIRDGRTAYERHQYHEAIPMLEKEYGKEKTRQEKGKIAYLLGRSNEEITRDGEAAKWYRIAYDNNYGVEALRGYAYSLKRNEQYEDAGQAFRELGLEIGSIYEFRKEIEACELAMEWMKSPSREYLIEPADFNSSRADYAPALFGNNQLVFSSDRAAATGETPYLWTGQDFSDLFLVDLNSGNISPFDAQINTENNEGTAVFSADGSEMFFTRCFSTEKFEDNYCKLMLSQRIGNQWTAPVVLPFVEEEVNYAQPALSADGNTLYFSSDHPDGWGGFDIYQVDRIPGGWGDPKLLSRAVNTPFDEQFPYMDQDTLYFASDGHTGMGGLDIYRTYKQSGDYWSKATNLKAPINSGADDFGLIFLPKSDDPDLLKAGYFSSSRRDGSGGDDIYRFEKRIPDEPAIVVEPASYQIFLDVYVLEKIYEVEGNPNAPVLGRKPLAGSKLQVFPKNKEDFTLDKPGENESFRLELEPDQEYRFLATRDGYISREGYFSTIGIGQDPENPIQEFELEIVLDRIFANQEIVLENIYYDFDRWDIREDARPTLDQLGQDLLLNPELSIQLASHTDCRGQTRYNADLSLKRAQSAVAYLIQLGVSPERLIARGFGEEQPAVDCACPRCTEEEHQSNRRTTFTILQ
ncbi:MAG: OmpA family protein [Saprospiraceae bacterium]|nr:OmpA family protein [Saprospiraceae bacterium]